LDERARWRIAFEVLLSHFTQRRNLRKIGCIDVDLGDVGHRAARCFNRALQVLENLFRLRTEVAFADDGARFVGRHLTGDEYEAGVLGWHDDVRVSGWCRQAGRVHVTQPPALSERGERRSRNKGDDDQGDSIHDLLRKRRPVVTFDIIRRMPTFTLFESVADLERVLPVFLTRCFVAALCGGLVGIERERKSKPAGFRTNILICLGSAIYMAVGMLIPGQASDPTRIAAQVVTGIGFLGAGCIIQSDHRVRGLTSAATIWVVAAIGIVVGAGYPILALIATTIVIVTLGALHHVERRFFGREELDEYRANDGDTSR
jgi:hypothetical protein